MGALMPPTAPGAVASAEVLQSAVTPDGGEAAEAVLASRAGSVLGAHCVLKQEPYPGVQSVQLPVLHDGAPNFRQASLLPAHARTFLTPLTGSLISCLRCGHLDAARNSCHASSHGRHCWRGDERSHLQPARGTVHLPW